MKEDIKTQRKISALEEKKEKINAQLGALSARQHLQKKKAEDRLKWILGNLVFDCFLTEPALQELVRRELPSRLTKRDRERGIDKILIIDTEGSQL